MSENAGTEGGTTTEGGAGETSTTTASGGTFTQADIDRIVGDRLAKQRAQFKDYDDLKAKASELDTLKESQKSDAQKLADRAEQAEAKAATAVTAAVRAEVKAIASGEFADPSDAALYLGDLAQYLDKNGEPKAAAIEEALKEVLKRKPHLAASTRSTDVGLGARSASEGKPNMNDLIRQRAAR